MTDGNQVAGGGPRRRALILAGGGMKVGYQAGALQVLLDEARLTFEHADGTSGGCLNLAMLQSGLSGTRIANNWRTTGPFELTSLQHPLRFLAPWRLPSLLTFDRLTKQLPVWGVDFEKVRASTLEGTYNVYNFTDKRLETRPGTELTLELFQACFALPIWFPAVEIDGKTYIDGVYWKDANLTEAVRRGADEIWVIWTVSEGNDYARGPYGQYFAIIEAIADGRFYEELREIEAINEAVRAATDTEHREIVVHVVRHATPVPLDYLLFFSAGDMSRVVDMGVRDTRAYLRDANIPFEPSGPLAPPIGLRFVEVMRGAWTRGATDPQAGADAGRRQGDSLAVKLAISIDDMDAFLVDPEREAHAAGVVDCPALGGRLAIDRGTFNVLPPEQPAGRVMHYRLWFHGADGRPYLLDGRKHVLHDRPFDAWADTTTLFVRILAGGEDGDVVGAGIIELRLRDLVRQVFTFRVLHGADVAARLVSVLGFARYFAGTLWDSYVRRR